MIRPRGAAVTLRENHRAGQSLIEILVTIALLIIGVFTVLRLFPIGFKMIRQSASQGQLQQAADDLAQTIHDGQLQAPEGIVEALGPFPAEGLSSFWAVPNSPGRVQAPFWNTSLPRSIPPDSLKKDHFELNALFEQRKIIGERLKLTSNGGASLLLFGPLYANAASIDSYVRVYDPRGYTQMPAVAPFTKDQFTGPHQFAILPDGSLAISADAEFLASAGEYLTLNFRGIDSRGQTYDIIDKLVAIPPATQNDLARGYAVVDGATAFGPIPPAYAVGDGSVQVFRAFPSGSGGLNTGTFRMVNPYAGVVQISGYTLSYTGANGYPQTSTVIAPDATLAVDYMTRDWQILRMDRDVPGDLALHLPINNLDIMDRAVSPTVRVLIVNLNDPTQSLAISNVVAPGATPAPGATGAVNVRDGIVYLPSSWAGTPVRVYYSPYNSWAAQPVMSFRSYTQAPGIGTVQGVPGYRLFELAFDAGGSIAADDSAKTAFLLFTRADLGKTVSVDYHFFDTAGREHRVMGQSYRIEGALPDSTTGFPTVAFAALRYEGPYGAISGSIQSPSGYAIQPMVRSDVQQPEVVIDKVQGISLEARGIFLESGDVLRADELVNSSYPDPNYAGSNPALIWNYPSQNPPEQIGRLGEATEDVYISRP